jgi:hypothetical protein
MSLKTTANPRSNDVLRVNFYFLIFTHNLKFTYFDGGADIAKKLLPLNKKNGMP